MNGGTNHTRFAAGAAAQRHPAQPDGADPLTAALMASALRLADRAVIADIEGEAVRVHHHPGRLYDLRPMLDPREHGPESVDMASEALAYAYARGLIVAPNPAQPLLALIVAPRDL